MLVCVYYMGMGIVGIWVETLRISGRFDAYMFMVLFFPCRCRELYTKRVFLESGEVYVYVYVYMCVCVCIYMYVFVSTGVRVRVCT